MYRIVETVFRRHAKKPRARDWKGEKDLSRLKTGPKEEASANQWRCKVEGLSKRKDISTSLMGDQQFSPRHQGFGKIHLEDGQKGMVSGQGKRKKLSPNAPKAE